MIRALVQKLGLDRIGDLVADEAKRVHVEVLREEREVLARMIAKLDERIASLGGKRRGRPPKATPAIAVTPTRRPRRKRRIVHASGETLKVFVLRALGKARGRMKIDHLVRRVQQLGYRTASSPKNLLLRIYGVLRDENVFRKVGTGLYTLALPPTRKTAKRKRVGPLLASSKVKRPKREKKPAAEETQPVAEQAATAEEKA